MGKLAHARDAGPGTCWGSASKARKTLPISLPTLNDPSSELGNPYRQMAAIGELLVYLLQGLLVLLALVGIRRLYQAASARKRLLAIAQIISASGLLLRGFYLQKEAENKYIGTYVLTAYPACTTCLLALKPANQYEVRQGDLVKEAGSWHYKSGGDYWAVEIGDNGRLGTGRFDYDYNARKANSQKPTK
jgi:hypothetical protein